MSQTASHKMFSRSVIHPVVLGNFNEEFNLVIIDESNQAGCVVSLSFLSVTVFAYLLDLIFQSQDIQVDSSRRATSNYYYEPEYMTTTNCNIYVHPSTIPFRVNSLLVL